MPRYGVSNAKIPCKYGNMKELIADSVDDMDESMGVSDVMAINVSAATMPPMEWPINIVRTDGSIVGEGVRFATSISITFSCSLEDCEPHNRRQIKFHTYQSLNLLTHSAKSPLVSNFGYTIARTSTLGRACWTSRERCLGKSPNVSSPPYRRPSHQRFRHGTRAMPTLNP